MNRLELGLLGFCGAVVAAGLVGISTHESGSTHRAAPPTTVTPATSVSPRSTTTAPAAGPGPSSQALAANLLAPTDLGGFYRVNPAVGAALIRSAPCIAGLGPSRAQTGSASVGLVGPDAGGLPFITEIVASYPGSTASGVYQQVETALASCANFAANIEGTQEHVPLVEGNLQPVGDASSEFEGSFNAAGRAERLQVGLALSSQDVVCVVWVAAAAGDNPIYGDLPSTLSAAIGKLA
ncbi:MAG TPA: hypothetical protein VFV02_16120 [Acidimicrobiales bacterium]|nr:hypothetical protein [Acidimicrobiales bacterium]